ncbi:DUF917 domain-containing protein [Planomicrobium sp. CPCC 101079]|uniref:DUF917 domain-containing protein n=1 Tax=Planomicrobium sp. CPCC 101079 TaxID=2599618 RepID=UPI0011B6B17F|nr:DUF917 domain-containing protein [Planomicrobium sp. CPCC 101079]TWT03651.1 DUF917 domain-containing protein [Planomicrobium sp. CPCC 101079]
MARLIGVEDIEYLAIGAAVLGTGGGGDPHLGKIMAQQAIKEFGPVTLLEPDEMPDDKMVVPVAMMGAPTVFVEKIPNGDEALHSLRRLEEYLGKEAYAVMPMECGGLNSTIPFVVAARAGIPIVDADGMGRAFPELQMETFNIYGVSGTPMVITDERGDWSLLNTVDNNMLEHIARGIAIRMGGVGHIAEYPMTGVEMKRSSIFHTVTLAIELGKAIVHSREKQLSPMPQMEAALIKAGYGKPLILFEAKITDVDRATTDGFAKGTVTLEGIGEYKGATYQVDFQNENLIAYQNGEVLATVPDLITFLDLDTFKPLTTETLRYGYRISCLAIPTPSIMRSEAALKVWGPQYFGYDLEFVPVEELNEEAKIRG